MKELEHPFKNEIETVRKILLAVDPKITEQIKWNGPSFGYGDDRITFRLNPPKNIQLIFHRGAKVRKDVESFSFDDPTGLVQWITSDRGTVTFKDMKEIEKHSAQLMKVAKKWLKETAD